MEPGATAHPDRARLLIECPDGQGIVAAVSAFLATHGGNIVESDQHSTHPTDGRFFMRMEVDLDDLTTRLDGLRAEFETRVAGPRAMTWRLEPAGRRKRMALLAGREPHCLLDLLARHASGELAVDIPVVASNHPDHRAAVQAQGIEYVLLRLDPADRTQGERQILAAVAGRADFGVLARYMQILSGDLLRAVGMPLVNIHHSFLPAFAGADPYRRAFERGVKIIGATAHYVTEELDAGPIIAQDVARVTHRADPAELARIGADIERVVLATAVRWHAEDRVISTGKRTVVFA